jgi:hypothetical protein
VPKAAVDLTANLRLDRYARPRYKKLAVDNCGLFMTAKGTLKIKGGISYNEYNVGDFEDLEMFGGDINVQGTMRVGGTLRGNVRDILVTFDAGLYVNNMAVQNVRNFDVAASGAFHTASSMDLEVTEKYRHAGQMSSGGSLGLYVAAGLSSNQSGMLLASDEVSTDVTRTDKPVQKLNSPPLLSDPAIHNYLTTKAPKVSKDTKTANANLNDDKLDKLRDAYYERMKYKEKDPDIWLPALRYSGKNRKFIVYTDYYLNVITYHYHNGRLVNITETGYIWQKRDKSEQEVPMEASPEIQRLIDALNDVAKEPGMAMIISGLKKEKADQAYQKQLTADLEKAGAAPADIATVFDDPLMKALRDLRYMSDTRQDELFAKKPYVQDLSEYMEDARDAMAERLESYLDSPVKRFIDDVVIPVLTIGTILAGDLVAPMTAPATVPALVASAGRLAVPLSRVATAIGVNEIYQQLQKFFNEKFGGGDKGRIQNTPQEARGYLQGLKDMNVLGRGHRSGKYMTHEITKDCTYKGYKFKKGNIISRDTRHHEIEVFQDSKTHLGAIEPRGGTMYKGQDLAKKLHGY